MTIIPHKFHTIPIAEITDDIILISNADEALQLMADLYYQDFNKIILHEENITPAFFDLSSGIAGEVLQKFSNYGVQLAIVGDFEKYPGKSLSDFIYESNKGRQVSFLNSVEEALGQLSR